MATYLQGQCIVQCNRKGIASIHGRMLRWYQRNSYIPPLIINESYPARVDVYDPQLCGLNGF